MTNDPLIDTYRESLRNALPGFGQECEFAKQNGTFHPQVMANRANRVRAMRDKDAEEAYRLRRKKELGNIWASVKAYARRKGVVK